MTTFEDNAVVTAEDLNNIAVDLGDTTFSAFSEEKFGVDKLNEITADLVSKGILTVGDRCEPIISDGKVYVKSGVIVFGSGAKIRISAPVQVDASDGDYIYAYNDIMTGKASIIASATMPTTGDYVMLAQRSGDSVADLRTLATAKALSTADFSVQTFSNTIVYGKNGYSGSIELGTTLLKHLAGFKITGVMMWYNALSETTNCFCDFTNMKTHTVNANCSSDSSRYATFEFTLEGTTLLWRITYISSPRNEADDEITMSVDMI